MVLERVQEVIHALNKGILQFLSLLAFGRVERALFPIEMAIQA